MERKAKKVKGIKQSEVIKKLTHDLKLTREATKASESRLKDLFSLLEAPAKSLEKTRDLFFFFIFFFIIFLILNL